MDSVDTFYQRELFKRIHEEIARLTAQLMNGPDDDPGEAGVVWAKISYKIAGLNMALDIAGDIANGLNNRS